VVAAREETVRSFQTRVAPASFRSRHAAVEADEGPGGREGDGEG